MMDKMKTRPKPWWWPENPYPEDIFVMSREDAINSLPTDSIKRTAVAGALGRIFWEIASDTIWEHFNSYFNQDE